MLRAFDPKLNRVVAIKVMALELAANTMAVKRFLREARAAAAVSHDHVVTIHAIHDSHWPPFIVMEFVDGPSLQEKIDQTGGLPLEKVLRIGMQTARGLSEAHEQGLVHRDIKPANILLENGVERVKLTDFGLARAVDDVSVTQTGQIAGTPQFMSPEQAEGATIDARSDLFSLGSVLYTMCTGRPPFRAETAVAMLRRVTDDGPRPIREVNVEIPDWLEAIIFKLLAKDPAERFQSTEEVADRLSQHLAHLQNPTTVPQPQPVVPPRLAGSLREPKPLTEQADTIGKPASRRKWPAIAIRVVALLCGIVVLGTIIYFLTNHGTVRVEVLDPDAQVTLRGDRDQIIEIKGDDVTLRIRPEKTRCASSTAISSSRRTNSPCGVVIKSLVRVSRIDGKFEVWASGTIIGRQLLSRGVVSASIVRRPTLYTISQDGDVVRINLSNASFQVTVVKKLGEAFCDVEGLAMSDDETLYAAVHGRNDASHLYTIDIRTGAVSKIGAMGVAEVDGLAWRYGQFYAVTSRFGGHNAHLLEAEPTTGQTRAIGKRFPLNDLDSLAFDDRGRLLTTDGMGIVDKIYQLDRRGAASPKPLAPTPPIVADRDIEGLTLAADGKLYGVTHPNSENQGPNLSHLVRIDPETFEYEDLGLLDFGTFCIAAGHRTADVGNQLTPFVMRQRLGRDEQAFVTLASAVSSAMSGDVIEVRGNGPYVSAPIFIRERALTIRVGEGFRPVIELSPDVKDATPLIYSHAALVVEGLQFGRAPVVETDDEDRGYPVIRSFAAPLFVANCEFSNRFLSILASRSPVCEIRNCMFVQSRAALSYTPPSGGRLRMQNNVHTGNGLLHLHYNGADHVNDVLVEITHNSMISRPFWLFLHELPKLNAESTPPIRIQFNDNVVDAVLAMLHFGRVGDLLENHEPLSAEEMELALKRTLAWQECRNLYDLQGGYVETGLNSRPKSGPAFSIKSNEDWQRFWGIDQKGALFGRAFFAGGDSRKRSGAELQLLTLRDFRLQGGPGIRTASDSRNLGIAANYVGPGEGYQRWTTTSEYQDFLESVDSVLPTTTPKDSKSLDMALCLVPAGDFEMGTADEDVEAIKADDDWFFADFVPGRREAETPQHRVTISKPFEMSAHEVTVAQFRQFVEATSYKTTAEQEREGYSWRNGEW